MKHSIFNIPLSVLLLLLAACSQSEPLPGAGEKTLLRVSSLQTEGATEGATEKNTTRAVATPGYPTTGSIGFFVKKDDYNGYTEMSNIKGTYSSTSSVWQPVDNIWLNDNDATIAVYAPYDATQTTATTLNLAAALRPADGTKDIWYAYVDDVNFNNSSPTLTMNHVYTRFVVNVTRAASYTSDAKITALKIFGGEIYSTAKFHPLTRNALYYGYEYGDVTGFTATAEKTLNASTASVSYDMLLIPTVVWSGIRMTFTVNSQKMNLTLAHDRFPDYRLYAGQQYTINVSLRAGELSVSSVTMMPWVSVPIDGGDMDFK